MERLGHTLIKEKMNNLTKGGKMNDKLKEAIDVLKDYRKGDFVGDDLLCRAIDTVVAELEKPLTTETFKEMIERLWKEYRTITNNEDAWCFKNWLVERVRIESTLLTEKCDVCGCHPSILIRTSFGTFCQTHVKY